jgi:hypothetical protein
MDARFFDVVPVKLTAAIDHLETYVSQMDAAEVCTRARQTGDSVAELVLGGFYAWLIGNRNLGSRVARKIIRYAKHELDEGLFLGTQR